MPPKVISHYRVVRRLGAGGMGQVFLAEDTKLDRSIALKLLPKAVAEDASRRKRFLVEAKAASALNHPSVCIIHEVGETPEGQPFIAMEYLEGQTLEALTRHRRLELREIVGIGVQVVEALEAARQHQVVHRDIKPGNIMMDAQGRVKVLDFGLAKRLDRPADASNVTQEGAIVGTPNYLSPELALGREVDSRTDIFSLGVVLYELAARQNPFAGASFGETVNNILNKNPDPLKPWNPNVTPEFERIVSKCLEKEPAKRYATPAQLRDDLAKLQTHLQTPRASSQKLWAVAAIVVAVGVTALGLTWLMRSKPATHPAAPAKTLTPVEQNSLAVLPFLNLSADKADEYLSDGISEDLSTALTPVKGLNVRSWQSCRAFKGKIDDIRKIGEQLSVAMVLAGSVTKAGNKLRINAQLSDVVNGTQLWATTHDREMADILEIRSDIARQLANALKARLGLEETQRLVKKPTINAGAYRLYLQGRYLWNRRTGDAIKQATECFNQAIARDPAYALAYSGLADCYLALSEYGGLPAGQTYPEARAAALRALQLDGSLAEPRATLAYVKGWYDWDWSSAEEEFRQAIALKPENASAHQWLALLLRISGRYEESLSEYQRAKELDPISPIINASLGGALFRSGRKDPAIEILQKQTASDPTFAVAHRVLGYVYLRNGNVPQAIEEFETVSRLVGSEVYSLSGLAVAQVRAGKTNEAQMILRQMQEFQQRGLDYHVGIAATLHALRDDQGALDSLEKGVEEHAESLELLACDPEWNDLRSHPRFQAILKKMNLAPAPGANTPASATAPTKSVAVLPFVNLSADKADEYLSDGMTEELLNALAKIKGLRVPARTSCFVFKGKTEDIQQIGEKLHVSAILEGSVRKVGNQLRITAQLINVADGFHLWSDTYDRDMTNIFVIQSDIASRVAAVLKVQLLGAASEPARNIDAYTWYLKGRSLWNRRTPDGLKQAVEHFNQAIAIDPGCALAYAGLADCYVTLNEYTGLSRAETLPKARAAARRALELDNSLAGPHAALAYTRAYLEWDWAAAEADLKQVVLIHPNYATALHWLALLHELQGRYADALAEFKRAQEIDPLSPVIAANLSYELFMTGEHQLAIDALKRQIELDPSFAIAHSNLGVLFLFDGNSAGAVAEFETMRRLQGHEVFSLENLGAAYALAGRTNEAQKVLADLQEFQGQGLNCRGRIAYVQYMLGDLPGSLDSYEHALKENSYGLEFLCTDPLLENLRAHPRVQTILKKMNLLK